MSMEVFSSFFSTPVGVGTVVAVIGVVLLLLGASLHRNRMFSVQYISYSGICIAMAFLLSKWPLVYHMPQGGSVTLCSMLFIALVGYWFGPAAGILAGVTHGLLDLAINPFVVHPIQLLLDYPLAFGALGLAGFVKSGKRRLEIGCAVAFIMRGFFSVISGVVFFAEYAGEMNPLLYSLTYNYSYILVELALTLIIINIPPFRRALDGIRPKAA